MQEVHPQLDPLVSNWTTIVSPFLLPPHTFSLSCISTKIKLYIYLQASLEPTQVSPFRFSLQSVLKVYFWSGLRIFRKAGLFLKEIYVCKTMFSLFSRLLAIYSSPSRSVLTPQPFQLTIYFTSKSSYPDQVKTSEYLISNINSILFIFLFQSLNDPTTFPANHISYFQILIPILGKIVLHD